MSDLEQRVEAHYTTSELLERILDAVEQGGGDRDALQPADLKPVDEFHTGGLQATTALLDQLTLQPSARVLDIGCGVGGTARLLAERFGVEVTGVDLTADYVHVARRLTELVGLKASFEVASALELPFDDGAFDVATMFHVGMNIEDKATLMQEASRVLAPGGTFALFDVMKLGDGALTFPFPWAESEDFSFVESPETYRQTAAAAGLLPVAERERRQFALDFFAEVFARVEAGGAPALGIHLLMRETAPVKIRNYVDCCEAGLIGPVEMIYRSGATS